MTEKEQINYKECIHLIHVDNAKSKDGLLPLYKCEKGHSKCQETIFSEPCEDFETK